MTQRLRCCNVKPHRGLLVAGNVVRLASAVGMALFPVLYSHLMMMSFICSCRNKI